MMLELPFLDSSRQLGVKKAKESRSANDHGLRMRDMMVFRYEGVGRGQGGLSGDGEVSKG